MIIVAIFVNDRPVFARSARNQDGRTNKKGQTKYVCDEGSVIWHDRNKGAIVLVKKMLDTIKEKKL